MSRKISYTSGTASSSGNNWASALVCFRVHGADGGGNNISITLDNVDNVVQNAMPTLDTANGAGGSGWTFFTMDGSPLPTKEFSITVTGTVVWELGYIAA